MKYLFLCVAFGCSTTYRVATRDLDQIKSGAHVAGVRDNGRDLDLTHYSFDYHVSDRRFAQRTPDIASLNGLIDTHALDRAVELSAVPNREDKPWQRVGLGIGVGFVSGFGIGYAVSNRIAIERSAEAGAACTMCSLGTVLLGSFISAALGAGAGALVAYFAGSSLGESKPAVLRFLEAASEPASRP